MSSLKTFLITAIALIQLGVPTQSVAQQMPGQALQRLQIFATCTGRLSALVEFQWMFDGMSSEQTAREYRAMAALVEALLPDTPGTDGRAVLAWRIDAKFAQSRLLQRAQFSANQTEARRASRLAQSNIARCRALVGA